MDLKLSNPSKLNSQAFPLPVNDTVCLGRKDQTTGKLLEMFGVFDDGNDTLDDAEKKLKKFREKNPVTGKEAINLLENQTKKLKS